jgi:hypothetical protein
VGKLGIKKVSNLNGMRSKFFQISKHPGSCGHAVPDGLNLYRPK